MRMSIGLAMRAFPLEPDATRETTVKVNDA
jgi:hypothetical protein